MILVDYAGTAISNIMAELAGRTDVVLNVQVVRHMILNAIRSYKSKFGKEFGEIVIVCDSRKCWRKQVFPNYKINRKKDRTSSGFNWQNIHEALNIIKEELETTFPYPVVEVSNAEADDCIAALVMWLQNNQLKKGTALVDDAPQPIIIISADGDFKQLQKYANVKQYDPIRNKDIVVNENAERVLKEKIIRGDKGDSVPTFLDDDDSMASGKRATTLMTKKVEEWKGMSDEEIATDPYLMSKKYMKEYILKNLSRNRNMVDLSKVPQDIQDQTIANYLIQSGARNRSLLMNYFVKHGLNQLIEKMGEF